MSRVVERTCKKCGEKFLIKEKQIDYLEKHYGADSPFGQYCSIACISSLNKGIGDYMRKYAWDAGRYDLIEKDIKNIRKLELWMKIFVSAWIAGFFLSFLSSVWYLGTEYEIVWTFASTFLAFASGFYISWLHARLEGNRIYLRLIKIEGRLFDIDGRKYVDD